MSPRSWAPQPKLPCCDIQRMLRPECRELREGGNHKIQVLGPNVAMDGSGGERAVRAITVANTEPNETVLAHAERVGELADAGEEAGGKGLVKEHTREIMTDNAPRMVAIWRAVEKGSWSEGKAITGWGVSKASRSILQVWKDSV